MRRDRMPAAIGTSWLHQVGIEDVLCVCLLAFFAMQGAIPGIAPHQSSEMTNIADTGLMKMAGIGSQVIVNGAICILVLLHSSRLWRFAFALQWTAVLAAFAVCSTLWSQDATTTARRSVPFALATLFGLYLASRFKIRQQLLTLTATMVVLALASILLALFVPSIGLEASTGHFGNWQGAFTQKNACGRAMVFATAAVLSLRGKPLVRLCCFALFLFVLVMSGSRGAWLIEGMLLVCYGMLRLLERFNSSGRMLLLFGSIMIMACTAVAAWIYFPLLAGFVGRDATLTGRTAIWQQVWEAILKHPFVGYGFAAFWQGMKGESYNISLTLHFVVMHAHNGFLEIWLELGAFGLLVFLLSYMRASRKLWPSLRSAEIGSACWMVFVLFLITVYDLDENTLIIFNGLYWVLYVAAVADIEIMALECKRHRQLFELNMSGCVPEHATA
ncbi:O-antigen ligase [Alloacidobacterium sp.]|uniref:O-antigen ligase n=1 Tax=Alloacidobacterium sp. TaxID=2951999 RepID=UPI002D6F0405|nr:O-antigen ligase [Alloacidobacterium sp.]HYK35332.1 O-antigen ligase [Alloacidobacterium sp.]